MFSFTYGTFSSVYNIVEKIFFGNKLERARLEFLPDLKHIKRILILGEGDGRFLKRLREINSNTEIDCIELSEEMISKSKKRLNTDEHINFIHADFLKTDVKNYYYDAVVTHFFLDNFSEINVSLIVQKIEHSLCENSVWMNTDFYISDSGFKRFFSKLIVKILYVLFQKVLNIEGEKLISPKLFIQKVHLDKSVKRTFLISELYRKTN